MAYNSFPAGSFSQAVLVAYEHLDSVFRNSPQFESQPLGEVLSASVTLKIETVNPIGCFKGRGTEELLRVRHGDFSSGVVAASAGNFGQGLAYSARKYGLECTIYAPYQANRLKVEKIKSLGAKVVLVGRDFDEAKERAKEFAKARGATFIEDGREPELAIGAATIAWELFAGESSFDVLVVPLGNGSLLNGMAKVAKTLSPKTKVIGVCSTGAPAMALSFEARAYRETEAVKTIADGIAVRVPVDESLTGLFENVDEVVLVSDSDMKSAIRTLFLNHRLVAEPAGAAGVAALLGFPERFSGQRIAIPVCGANIAESDFNHWVFEKYGSS